MTIPPYPLTWPEGVPRTAMRQSSKFKTTLAAAIENVSRSLRLFGVDSGRGVTNVVATSNVGGLRMGGSASTDPGVAVWFMWDGEQRCIAVDRYAKVEHNLQAIHHIIEARRTEVRHGGLVIARTAFRGFSVAQIEAPGAKPWHAVLGVPVDAPPDVIRAAHRRLAAEHHPDRGGNPALMAEINRARDIGLRERPT